MLSLVIILLLIKVTAIARVAGLGRGVFEGLIGSGSGGSPSIPQLPHWWPLLPLWMLLLLLLLLRSNSLAIHTAATAPIAAATDSITASSSRSDGGGRGA